MTKEEARNELVHMRCTKWFSPDETEALDEAIVSLQQPEIIRCKDCRYFKRLIDPMDVGLGECEFGHSYGLSVNHFCSWAER